MPPIRWPTEPQHKRDWQGFFTEGTQVVSVWGRADQPGKVGEIVIYFDKTLKEVARVPNLVTPTGRFNVYNTVKDIY